MGLYTSIYKLLFITTIFTVCVQVLGCNSKSNINKAKLNSCNSLIVEMRSFFKERPYLLDVGMGIDHLSTLERDNLKFKLELFTASYDSCYLEQVYTDSVEGYFLNLRDGNTTLRMYNTLISGVIDGEFKERTFMEMKMAGVYKDFSVDVLGNNNVAL